MVDSFYPIFMRAVNKGIDTTRTKIDTELSLPVSGRSLDWDLVHFMRLDKDLLGPEAGPETKMALQLLSFGLSEFFIRMILNGKDPAEAKSAVLRHAELIYTHRVKKMGPESKEGVKNEEE